MSVDRLEEPATRPAEHLLAWAFGLSLVFHLLAYGGFHLGQHFGWWNKSLMPAWFKSTKQTLAEIKKAEQQKLLKKQQEEQKEPPLLFVEVDPTVSTPEAPKKATHYSNRNSKAGNPDISMDTPVPKIDGRQTHVPKTQDAPRSQPRTLQPAAPKPAAPTTTPGEADNEEKAKPKSSPPPGNLAMAKPSTQPSEGQVQIPDTGEAKTTTHRRPHTLIEAMNQQHPAIPGEKMRQDGGVQHHLDSSAFDTIATPFGEYDSELVNAISSHWWDLLERKEFSQDRRGKVVVQFTLHADGRVTDVIILESDVGDLLASVCKLAIIDPAPYAPWPTDMRQYFAKDNLDIKFTFWYE